MQQSEEGLKVIDLAAEDNPIIEDDMVRPAGWHIAKKYDMIYHQALQNSLIH